MNVEVCIKSLLTAPPVVLRALVANNSLKTQISSRLANKLNFNSTRDVYTRDYYGSVGDNERKWKISMAPMIFSVKRLKSHNVKVVYPLINCNESDGYYEMIIGQDCQEQWEISNACSAVHEIYKSATPGPAFRADVDFMGHNIELVNLCELPAPPDEYFEYMCFDSPSLSRLAVNKAASAVAVVYRDSPTVYRYEGVAGPLFQMLEDAASKQDAVEVVKAMCPVTVLEVFPDAVLTNVDVL